jgi:hypothetical protein
MRALKVTVARLGILVALLLPSPQVIPEVDSGGYPRVVLVRKSTSRSLTGNPGEFNDLLG